MTDTTLRQLHVAIDGALQNLAELFEPEMKLAFVAYKPGNPEREVMVGSGEPGEVIEVMRRMMERDEVK